MGTISQSRSNWWSNCCGLLHHIWCGRVNWSNLACTDWTTLLHCTTGRIIGVCVETVEILDQDHQTTTCEIVDTAHGQARMLDVIWCKTDVTCQSQPHRRIFSWNWDTTASIENAGRNPTLCGQHTHRHCHMGINCTFGHRSRWWWTTSWPRIS